MILSYGLNKGINSVIIPCTLIITYREGDIESPGFLNTKAGRQSRVRDNQNNQKSVSKILTKI